MTRYADHNPTPAMHHRGPRHTAVLRHVPFAGRRWYRHAGSLNCGRFASGPCNMEYLSKRSGRCRVNAGGIALFVAMAAATAARAEPDAPYPCEKAASETAQRLNSSILQKAKAEGEYSLSDVNGTKLRFACPVGRQRFPRLHLSWPAAYPPRTFWEVVSTAGTQLTTASARRLNLAAHQCHKAAALAEAKHAAVRQLGLGIECQVSAGPTALTTVTIHRRSNRRP